MSSPDRTVVSTLPQSGRALCGNGRGRAPAASASNPGYFLLGFVLALAFLVQDAAGLRWGWLSALQADDLYKQISGFVLLAYVAQQWHLSVLRSRGLMRKASGMLRNHKLLGAIAPLFLYAHTQTLGFAYQLFFSVTFFAVFLSGLLNQEVARIRKPWFHPLWIMIHAGLAMALLVMLGYHVFITYAYQ